ncbi:MAG: intermembrane transport protein PqiB [Akkermansiaceae bacterium]|nr:intermembrane transport protein PqiB [Akkermansiaceae bacterium]
MSDQEDSPVFEPEVAQGRRISLVWIVPLVAVVLGVWLAYRHVQDQGPLVSVNFLTAEGIAPGKTEVRCRSVKVGQVESVRLSESIGSVIVDLRINPKSAELVRENSRFWVVRPRVTGAGISGLGTIITGAYIELDPGKSGSPQRLFTGLEEPPVTPSNVPGLRLNLVADGESIAGVGSPVAFAGNKVGTVERRRFDGDTRQVELRVFIEADYAGLVTENTRFWAERGVELLAGAEGFKFEIPSLEALVAGGVSFGVPEELEPGGPVADGTEFVLYDSRESAVESIFRSGGEFLLLFDQSVRGLVEGARVEFRGLRVGRVVGISFLYSNEKDPRRVPVMVQLNEAVIEKSFPPTMRDEGGEGLSKAVAGGLRASLRSANLLTGQLFVDLDFYDDAPPAEVAMLGDHAVLPTIETGLARLEEQVAAVLAKIEKLPLEESLGRIDLAVEEATRTLESSRKAIDRSESAIEEARDALAAIRKVVEDDNFAKLPAEVRDSLAALRRSLEGVSPESSAYGDIRRTLDELRGAARSIERVAETIEEKPNALIFGKGSRGQAIPRAKPVRP